LVGRSICENPQQQDHWSTRNRAAKLLADICHKYGRAYHRLQPRVTTTLLRAFLDPARPLTTQYGAIIGLDKIGPEVCRVLVVPNIKFYSDNCLRAGLNNTNPLRVTEAMKCKEALVVSCVC
jgi:transcription initiation factor TFIID subunit 6